MLTVGAVLLLRVASTSTGALTASPFFFASSMALSLSLAAASVLPSLSVLTVPVEPLGAVLSVTELPSGLVVVSTLVPSGLAGVTAEPPGRAAGLRGRCAAVEPPPWSRRAEGALCRRWNRRPQSRRPG